jgi:Protein of unknown function (DUF3892)
MLSDAIQRPGVPVADVQLTCTIKPRPDSPHEDITHVGTSRQVWPREQVVGWIEARTDTFYTIGPNGKRADVGVVRELGKVPYLRTQADGHWNDNLLALSRSR